MTLLRIDASIQGTRSAGVELADRVVDQYRTHEPDEVVVVRHLGVDPLPAQAWGHAVSGAFVPDADRTPAQVQAVALATELARELRSADGVVLASPLYNFGVSQHVKTWIDLVVAGAAPGERLLSGTPVTIVVTRGGAYGAGTPREGWDHATAYLTRILVDVWGADLTVVEREFTLVGINPALDEFGDLAGQMRDRAHVDATRAGRVLAGAGAGSPR